MRWLFTGSSLMSVADPCYFHEASTRRCAAPTPNTRGPGQRPRHDQPNSSLPSWPCRFDPGHPLQAFDQHKRPGRAEKTRIDGIAFASIAPRAERGRGIAKGHQGSLPANHRAQVAVTRGPEGTAHTRRCLRQGCGQLRSYPPRLPRRSASETSVRQLMSLVDQHSEGTSSDCRAERGPRKRGQPKRQQTQLDRKTVSRGAGQFDNSVPRITGIARRSTMTTSRCEGRLGDALPAA